MRKAGEVATAVVHSAATCRPESETEARPGLSDAVLRHLWTLMGEAFGHRWESAYGSEPLETPRDSTLIVDLSEDL